MKNVIWMIGEGFQTFELQPWHVFLGVGLSLLLPLTFYVLRSIGLYKLGKKENVKNSFLAWIPLVWVYVAGKVMGKVLLGGKVIKKFAVILTAIFVLSEVLYLTTQFLAYFPLIGYYLQGGQVYYCEYGVIESGGVPAYLEQYYFDGQFFVDGIIYPYSNLRMVGLIYTIISYVGIPLDILSTVGIVIAYVGIFRKYFPEHFILATVLSVLGLDGPFIFAVRNKKAVNYQEYMRSKYFSTYGAYTQRPYEPTREQERKRPEPNPFEEFDENSSKDDPFKDFDKDNKD